MAIEFHCQQCNTLLKTPDDSAGQQAKCPKCGALTTIPARTIVATPAAAYPPAAIGPPGETAAGGPLRTTSITVESVLNTAWAVFKANMGLCIGAVFVPLIIEIVAQGVAQGVIRGMSQGGDNKTLAAALSLIFALGGFLLQAWLHVGAIRLLLKIARGEPAEVGMVFSGAPWILPAAGAMVFVGIVTTLGFLLCIIPGIIFAFMFSQTVNIVVDQNADPLEAMKVSKQITTGNKWTLFLLGLVAWAINMVGVLALCIGLVFTVPFTFTMMIVAYLQMSGQTVSAPAT